MLLKVVAAGTRLPSWVNEGFADYAGRLRSDYRLLLTEIPLGRRPGGDPRKAVEEEGSRMLASIARDTTIVALQVGGKALATEQLAAWLQEQARETSEIAFCIGGPDGLSPDVDARARLKWSLSSLTLPHALARVVVAEALYRAVTVIKGHPYHRG